LVTVQENVQDPLVQGVNVDLQSVSMTNRLHVLGLSSLTQ